MNSAPLTRATVRAVLGLVLVGLPYGAATGTARLAAAENSARSAARASVTSRELQAHAAALADDTFEGREAGSRGSRAAAGYILGQLEKLRERRLVPAGGGDKYTQAFDYANYNLLALLPGDDPQLQHEVIVVCAHYDHVGYGSANNSYGPVGKIHNGADDNASGVATVLETAQAIASLDRPLRRSILFAFWDGEEKGLLGSKHWLSQPTLPKTHVVRMAVNFDMVGRMRDHKVEVYGTRTARGLRRLISHKNADDLVVDFMWAMTSDSDHHPFFLRNIPSLMFHTGKHGDYHRPSDDVEKLNLDGMQSIGRMAVDVVIELADADVSPSFRAESIGEGRDERVRDQFERPLSAVVDRLGILTKNATSPSPGAVVTLVNGDGPAARAGIEVGDRITHWNDDPLADARNLQARTASHVGSVELRVVPRNLAQAKRLSVELVGLPVRIGITWIRDEAEPSAAIVKRVYPGSPAEAAALDIGDRIDAVGGKTFASSDEFEALLNTASGETELTIERRGRIFNVAIRLPPQKQP